MRACLPAAVLGVAPGQGALCLKWNWVTRWRISCSSLIVPTQVVNRLCSSVLDVERQWSSAPPDEATEEPEPRNPLLSKPDCDGHLGSDKVPKVRELRFVKFILVKIAWIKIYLWPFYRHWGERKVEVDPINRRCLQLRSQGQKLSKEFLDLVACIASLSLQADSPNRQSSRQQRNFFLKKEENQIESVNLN